MRVIGLSQEPVDPIFQIAVRVPWEALAGNAQFPSRGQAPASAESLRRTWRRSGDQTHGCNCSQRFYQASNEACYSSQ